MFVFLFFTLITNYLALTYSLKYDNANKMRQCENIFVFIDLTKSIGSDLGGQLIFKLDVLSSDQTCF